MPRPRLIIPKRSQEIRIPEDLLARVLADLYSDAEGCVPYGKLSEFIEGCIREHYRLLEDFQPLKAQVCTQAHIPPGESGGVTGAATTTAPGSMTAELQCPYCPSKLTTGELGFLTCETCGWVGYSSLEAK